MSTSDIAVAELIGVLSMAVTMSPAEIPSDAAGALPTTRATFAPLPPLSTTPRPRKAVGPMWMVGDPPPP